MYGEWRLTYSGVDLRFGTPDYPVQVVKYTFASNSIRTEDTERPREDGTAFGRDFIESGALQIRVLIDFTDYPAPPEVCAKMAWEARSEFDRLWRADYVRRGANRVAELTMGGSIAFEGRSRPIAWDDDNQNVGQIYGTALFVPAGTGVIDVTDNEGGWLEEVISVAPALTGGIKGPLVAPISTAQSTSRFRAFQVGGGDPTFPIVRVKGPIQSGAQVEITDSWMMEINRALAFNDEAMIDTRPGHRRMTINGTPANVLTARSVPIAQASLMPGPNSATLRGISLEGTASARIKWRNLKESI